MVFPTNGIFGTDYEIAVIDLLRQETAWAVTQLDVGKRLNVPDIFSSLGLPNCWLIARP